MNKIDKNYQMKDVFDAPSLGRIKILAKAAYAFPARRDTKQAVAEITDYFVKSIRDNGPLYERMFFTMERNGHNYVFRSPRLACGNRDIEFLREINVKKGRRYPVWVRLSDAKGALRQEMVLELLSQVEYISHVCRQRDEETRKVKEMRREISRAEIRKKNKN